MASITLTIPSGVATRVLDSFAAKKGYTGFLSDGITPQTKTEFLKADLARYVKQTVADYEAIQASNAACIAAQNDVETNIVIS